MRLIKPLYIVVVVLLFFSLTSLAFSQETPDSTEINYDNITPELLLIIPVAKGANKTLTSVWGRKVVKYFIDTPLPKLEVKSILLADPKIKSNEKLIETYIKPNDFTLALLVELSPTTTSEIDFNYLVTLELFHRVSGQLSYHTFLANMHTYLDAIKTTENVETITQQIESQVLLDRIESFNLNKIYDEIRAFMTTDEFINWYTLQIVPPSDESQKYNFNISLKEDEGEILDTIEKTNTFMISSIDYPIQIFQEFPTGETILIKKFHIKKRNRDYNKKHYLIEVPAIPGTYEEYRVQEFNNQHYIQKPTITDLIGGVGFPISISEMEKKYISTASPIVAIQAKHSFQRKKLPLYVGGKVQVMVSNIAISSTDPSISSVSSSAPSSASSLIIDSAGIAQFGYVYSISGFDFTAGIGLGMNIGLGPTWKRIDNYTGKSSIALVFSTDLEAVYNIAKIVRILAGTSLSVHHGEVLGTNDLEESQSVYTMLTFTNMFINTYGGLGIRY